MSPSAQRSSSVPGKIFLLGEYAVLAGARAVIATVAPRFTLRADAAAEELCFAPASPAGLLLQSLGSFASLRGLPGHFEDPYRGEGGFGASSAQFALLFAEAFPDLQDWRAAWKRFCELTGAALGENDVAPSGADLVAQWQGGVSLIDLQRLTCENIHDAEVMERFLVFSAASLPGRKVATHEHLAALARDGHLADDSRLIARLQEPLEAGIRAVRDRDLAVLADCLNEYGDVLAHFDLENEGASSDRAALRGLEGVKAVKGSGAMQSDAILVLCDREPGLRQAVIREASARGLRLVSDGISCQNGLERG